MPCYGAYQKAFEYRDLFPDPMITLYKEMYLKGLEDGLRLNIKRDKELIDALHSPSH